MSEAPPGLAAFQKDFAAAMTAPIRIDNPSGDFELPIEAYPSDLIASLVTPPGLTEVDRLGVYNQQYWFRLLSVLQEEYPLLCALMGLVPFNTMSVAFLTAHPSRSPLLRPLSDPLTGWMASTPPYDRSDWVECATLEHHYIVAFDAAHHPILDPLTTPAERLLNEPLALQPHCSLFAETFDLVAARRRLKSGEHPSVPLTAQPGWWALYRADGLHAEPLHPLQYDLLAHMGRGRSLQESCDGVLAGCSPEQADFLAKSIQGWFARWMRLGWFCSIDGEAG